MKNGMVNHLSRTGKPPPWSFMVPWTTECPKLREFLPLPPFKGWAFLLACFTFLMKITGLSNQGRFHLLTNINNGRRNSLRWNLEVLRWLDYWCSLDQVEEQQVKRLAVQKEKEIQLD